MGIGYAEDRRVPLDTTIWGDVPPGVLDVHEVTDDMCRAAATVVAERAGSGVREVLDMLGLTERLGL